MTQYRDAREYLRAVREAAIEAERTRRTIERMRASEGVRAQGYEPGVSHTTADRNGTARVVARMDYEAMMERRVEEDWALIDHCCSLIYGREQDGRGGVAALLGSRVADVLWWRFCAAERWAVVGERCGYTARQCVNIAEEGMDAMDFFGVRALMEGEGLATE